MSVNLKAVAERAGVSLATASRVISRSDYPVREELRERVLAAAAELDYVPNAQARGLLQGNPMTVGVLVPYLGPLVNTFLEHLHKLLDPYGYLLTTITTGTDVEQTIRGVTTLQGHRTGTVIFADGGAPMSTDNERLHQRVKSMVASGHYVVLIAEESQLDLPLVRIPYSRIGAMVGEWLVDNGHTEVGLIEVGTDVVATNQQSKGFNEATSGITVHRVGAQAPTREVGRELAAELLDQHPNITAIVGEIDALAIGAVQEARARGIDIPGELSIIGAYDAGGSEDYDLTTVHVPQDDIARLALRAVKMVREDSLPKDRVAAEVEISWQERGTTAPVGKKAKKASKKTSGKKK
ncbi:LacI family DNA-binding transcriptional regulator [Enemella sp. A6]|uniref:LacI family DNA-binding transcriptional regulator n=1 Tax=Enemella sp. A6 TaxID=3440152 RepID=UPI003EC1053E